MTTLTTDTDWDEELANRIGDRERHRLLASERRRTILEALDTLGRTGSHVTLGELASDVDRIEQRVGSDTPSKGTLLIELHHVHLPVMDDVGIVAYDPDTKRVSIEPEFVTAPTA